MFALCTNLVRLFSCLVFIPNAKGVGTPDGQVSFSIGGVVTLLWIMRDNWVLIAQHLFNKEGKELLERGLVVGSTCTSLMSFVAFDLRSPS